MKNNFTKSLVISASILALVAACNTSNLNNNVQLKDINTSNVKISNIISGKVDFPKFQIKATVADVAPSATVSLIDPVNNSTKATGLTDAQGKFTINAGFNPSAGQVLILEANKRVNGQGNNLLSLRTYVKWNGTGFDSVTTPDLRINTLTTAICQISGYEPTFTPDMAIGKINVTGGTSQFVSLPTSLGITETKINDVSNMIKDSLTQNLDPVQSISFSGGNYSRSALGKSETTRMNGTIYELKQSNLSNYLPISGATVIAKSIEPSVNWTATTTTSEGGLYLFKDAPIGARIDITVTKNGFSKSTRSVVLDGNLQKDPSANVFDFSGFYYAIQDNPEINLLKINGKVATDSSGIGNSANLTGVSSNDLVVEMTFSEPVNRSSVENNFIVFSDSYNIEGSKQIINSLVAGVTFTWNTDDTMVTFKLNKPLKTEALGLPETNYIVSFGKFENNFLYEAGFKDKNNTNSISSFKFSGFLKAGTNKFSVVNR